MNKVVRISPYACIHVHTVQHKPTPPPLSGEQRKSICMRHTCTIYTCIIETFLFIFHLDCFQCLWWHISAIYLLDTYVNIFDEKVDLPHNYVDLSDNLVFQIMLVSRPEVDLLPTSAVNFSDKLVNIII